jgi:hypothetical protein
MTTEKCKIEEINVTTFGKDSRRYLGFLIKEYHTTSDIARLIIDQGWQDDIMDHLSNPEFVKDAKENQK